MTPQAQKAFDELKALGAPVLDRGGDNDGGHFIISGEDNSNEIWADYYKEFGGPGLDDFGVNLKINAILEKHGLFAEWYNPGFLVVHTA